MIPKIRFKVADKEKIAEFIFDLKNSLKIENLSERNYSPCIYINLSEELKKEVVETKELNNELKEKIKQHINISEHDIKNMDLSIQDITERWEEINDLFFLEIKEKIGNYFEEEYLCYITDKVVGAYFNNNEITIDYNKKLDLGTACFILAEELLHLIYWKMWAKEFNKEIRDYDKIFSYKKGRWSCWNIAEIIPEYLLVDNPSFKKFGWSNRKRYLCYKWILELRKILDSIWENKKDFKDFVIKAHKAVGINIEDI